MSTQKVATFALGVAVLAVAAACTSGKKSAPAAATTSQPTTTSVPPANAAQSGSPTLTTAARTSQAPGSTVDVVNALRPSVVRVRTEASQLGAFGSVQNASGTGTGVIFDSQGHVITNNHVVTLGSNTAASKIMVDLADGETVSAQLVGREPVADIAVLKIDATNLTPAKFADPKSIQVGQDVVAIGYALDLGSTPSVTKGVVSALNREIDETLTGTARGGGTQNVVGDAIQTDAAINPGNSGGPLVNLSGEVIGINTAGIFSSNGNPIQGINFAVSVDTIAPVAKALITNGRVDRGFLGVQLVPITREEAQVNKIPVSDGVGLALVTPGSPADKAGLKASDVIVKAGSRDIHTVGDMQQALIENGPGTKLHIDYYRGSTKQSTDVTLGARQAGS